MSDCFDHMADAYDSLIAHEEYEQGYQIPQPQKQSGAGYRGGVYNPLYHHVRVSFDKISFGTELCYVCELKGVTLWIAKKLCRKANIEHSSVMWVHRETLKKIIKEKDGSFSSLLLLV